MNSALNSTRVVSWLNCDGNEVTLKFYETGGNYVDNRIEFLCQKNAATYSIVINLNRTVLGLTTY